MISTKANARPTSGTTHRRRPNITSVTLDTSHLTNPAGLASLKPTALVSTGTARYMLNAPRALADAFSDYADREILQNLSEPGTSLEKRFGALGVRAVAASAKLNPEKRFEATVRAIEAGINSVSRSELGLFGKWLDTSRIDDSMRHAIASEYLRD